MINRGGEWTDLVEVLARMVRQHPQTAYDGLQKFLHKEWDFSQRINPHIGEVLLLVEEAPENPSSWPFSWEPLQKSQFEGSPSCLSSRCG